MMGMGMGMPPAKPKDFRGSFRRLFGTLRPERPLIIGVILLAIVSVALTVVGPKILGEAVNKIFEGGLSLQLGREFPGATQEQMVAAARSAGNNQLADMLTTLHLTPGHGVDFGALGEVVLVLIGLYVVSSIFAWLQGYIMAGVTQRTVYRLRADVDAKLGSRTTSTTSAPRSSRA